MPHMHQSGVAVKSTPDAKAEAFLEVLSRVEVVFVVASTRCDAWTDLWFVYCLHAALDADVCTEFLPHVFGENEYSAPFLHNPFIDDRPEDVPVVVVHPWLSGNGVTDAARL